jgi:putative transposase
MVLRHRQSTHGHRNGGHGITTRPGTFSCMLLVIVMEPYRKRCRRWNERGHAHALTFSCFRRRQFLTRDRSQQWLVDAIEQGRIQHAFHLWAFVIMPEHVHLLIWPTSAEYSISRILTTIKQMVSKRALYFVRKHSPEFLAKMADIQPNGIVQHRFWQRGGGYDRNLISPSVVWAEIDYIHANPVRRGLVSRPIDWYWSSACEYENPGNGPLSIDRESLPRTSLG